MIVRTCSLTCCANLVTLTPSTVAKTGNCRLKALLCLGVVSLEVSLCKLNLVTLSVIETDLTQSNHREVTAVTGCTDMTVKECQTDTRNVLLNINALLPDSVVRISSAEVSRNIRNDLRECRITECRTVECLGQVLQTFVSSLDS